MSVTKSERGPGWGKAIVRTLLPAVAGAWLLTGASCGPESLARNLFNLSVAPGEVSFVQGQGGQETVAVTMERGLRVDQDIALSLEGLPAGASFSLEPGNPQKGAEGTTQSTALTLTVASVVAAGVYPLTVKGTIFEENLDGSVTSDTQTVPLTLRILGEGGGDGGEPGDYTLTVSTEGAGTVTSDPAGIYCYGHFEEGSDCTQEYPSGTSVVLTATPVEAFTGWINCGEDDTGADGNACGVVMNQDRGVFAGFTSTPVNREASE